MLALKQQKLKYLKDQDFRIRFIGDAACCVKAGDAVKSDTAIFDGKVSQNLQSISLCKELSVKAEQAKDFLLKSDGEIVDVGEVIAARSVGMGFTEKVVKSKVEGRVSLSKIQHGIVSIMSPFTDAVLTAGVSGKVKHVVPAVNDEREIVLSVTGYVFVPALRLNCSTSVGASGPLYIVKNGNSIYRASDITSECEGKIVVVGRRLTVQLYEAAVEAGAKGIIAGGIPRSDFRVLSDTAIPVFITEGWGPVPFSIDLMDVFKKETGSPTFMDVAASKLVIFPTKLKDESKKLDSVAAASVVELAKGQLVKILDYPYFNYSGTIVDILVDECLVNVELESGKKIVLGPGCFKVI